MPQFTTEQVMALISILSTVMMTVVAILGIILNYRKDSRDDRKEEHDNLAADYQRRDADLKECHQECDRLQEENRKLVDENRQLKNQLDEYKLKEMIRSAK